MPSSTEQRSGFLNPQNASPSGHAPPVEDDSIDPSLTSTPRNAKARCDVCRKDRKKCVFKESNESCERCLQNGYSCNISEHIPPSQPRKHNRYKCDHCRRLKQKCLPEDRVWPAKCTYCAERRLSCSEPRVASSTSSDIVVHQERHRSKEHSPVASTHSIISAPTPLVPLFTIPFRRDDGFIDRGDLLKKIHERCWQSTGRAALVGLGGAGKSQLAIEYAYRMRQKSPEVSVLWIHASSPARLESDLTDIAERIGLSLQHDRVADPFQLVRRWLCNEANGRWLLILDNADELIEVQNEKVEVPLSALLPQTNHGAILVTSRNADVALSLVGSDEDIIMVGVMTDDEAVQLTRNQLKDVLYDDAIQLVNALDCIPLAISQAAAYLNRLGPRKSVAKYIGDLHSAEKQSALLRRDTFDRRRDAQASNSLFKTWQICFEHIETQQPSAIRLLAFMSFFSQHGIPEFIIRHYADAVDEDGSSPGDIHLEREDIDFEEDVAVLRAFSLIKVTNLEDEFEMHGLVQRATQMWLISTNAEREWRQKFVQAMAQEFPDGEHENWPQCQRLYPHVLFMIEQGMPDHAMTAVYAWLLNNAGRYAWRRGYFRQAQNMINDAFKIRQNILGADNLSTLLSASLLGSVLSDLGEYDAAEAMHRMALSGYEKVLGTEHPNTLSIMNGLAKVFQSQGRYMEAEAMDRQALSLYERVLGADHPDTLIAMNHLAGVLDSQGKHEESESIYKQTLHARERVFGTTHPSTLGSMNNLALVLSRQGKHKEAESILTQTLETSQRLLGPEHPDTLATANNLAAGLGSQGNLEEATELYQYALEASKRTLGVEHPSTLSIMDNLALVLANQSRLEEAESICRRILAARQNLLGAKHPDTLTTMNNLAGVLGNQGRHEEAEELHRHALSTIQEVLGAEHPFSLSSMNNLGLVLDEQGKLTEAEAILSQTLAISKSVLGSEHPDTLKSMNNLAGVLVSQAKYNEAERMYLRMSAVANKVLGPGHPDTRTMTENLVAVLCRQGKYEEAESIRSERSTFDEHLKDPKAGKDDHDRLVRYKPRLRMWGVIKSLRWDAMKAILESGPAHAEK